MGKTLLTTFPYYKNPEGDYFPIIPVIFHHQGKLIDTAALVDSGATISIFKSDVANHLGLIIEAGQKIFLGGVGGRIKGYIHKLEIETAGKRFFCPIVFSYEYLVSYSLLGREVFFNKFRIIFEEQKNYLRLE